MTARTMPRIWVDTKHASGDRLLTWSIRCQAASRTTLMRCMYATRLLYWIARHRSIETARWIVAFEGYTW